MNQLSRRRPLPLVLGFPASSRAGLIAAAFLCLPLQTHPGAFDLPGIRENEDSLGLSLWDSLLTIKAGGGYKDNPLLSPFTPLDTPIVTVGLEYFLTRLPVDGHQFTIFFSGDERRFVQPVRPAPEVDEAKHELVLLSQASYRYFGNHLVSGLTFTHLHAAQVFDASEFGGQPGTIRASGHALILAPSIRYPLPGRLYLQAEYVLTRQHFKEPVSSYWEFGPKASAGWQYQTNSSFDLSFQYIERPFDTRQQTDPLGQPLSGTLLTTFDTRYEASWKQTWYAPLRLQTTARVFRIGRVEDGEGFSDYTRTGGSLSAQMEPGKWMFRGLVRKSNYDFDLQIVSVFDPVPRTRVEEEFEARIEYRWTSRFRTYAEYLHERQTSNVEADDYHANTWQAGVEVDF